jgi:gliding motility-associated-like protein
VESGKIDEENNADGTICEITATPHPSLNAHWVVWDPSFNASKDSGELLRLYLFAEGGITQVASPGFLTYGPKPGQGLFNYFLVFSQDSRLFYDGRKVIYRFDPVAGRFDSLIDAAAITDSIRYVSFGYMRLLVDAEFSPSGRFLYVSEWWESERDLRIYPDSSLIVQYDLARHKSPGGIAASRRVVCRLLPEYNSRRDELQLAPDGKIYTLSHNSPNPIMGAIPQPDLPYPHCGYQEEALSLGLDTVGKTVRSWYLEFPNIEREGKRYLDLGPDTAICQGDTLWLRPQAWPQLGDSLYWNTGDTGRALPVTAPGTYWVRVSNPAVTVFDTIVVQILPLPVVRLGSDSTFCGSINHTLSPVLARDHHRIWSSGDTTHTLHVQAKGRYVLMATTLHGCRQSDTVNLDLVGPPLASGGDTLACNLPYLTLDAGNPGSRYAWSTGDTAQRIWARESGTYWVDIHKGTCALRDSIRVRLVRFVPTLLADSVLCLGVGLVLDADNPQVGNYLWNTGDTTQSIWVTHQGLYQVRIGRADCQMLDSAHIQFVDHDSCLRYLHLPNSFSPNGDGRNESFLPMTNRLTILGMSVYNRWGEEVYVCQEPVLAWDGLYQGQPVPEDTYFVRISYEYQDEGGYWVRQSVSGSIHLLR